MALITFQQAADHLKRTFPDGVMPMPGVADLQLKMEIATALVLDYIQRAADDVSPPWTDATDPALDPDFALVQAGILIVLTDLDRFRGDDQEESGDVNEHDIPPRAARILKRLKDPSFA